MTGIQSEQQISRLKLINLLIPPSNDPLLTPYKKQINPKIIQMKRSLSILSNLRESNNMRQQRIQLTQKDRIKINNSYRSLKRFTNNKKINTYNNYHSKSFSINNSHIINNNTNKSFNNISHNISNKLYMNQNNNHNQLINNQQQNNTLFQYRYKQNEIYQQKEKQINPQYKRLIQLRKCMIRNKNKQMQQKQINNQPLLKQTQLFKQTQLYKQTQKYKSKINNITNNRFNMGMNHCRNMNGCKNMNGCSYMNRSMSNRQGIDKQGINNDIYLSITQPQYQFRQLPINNYIKCNKSNYLYTNK